MDWQALLNHFAAHLKAERRYSSRTQHSYVGDAGRVLTWIGLSLGRPVQITDWTLQHLRAWQASEARHSASTVSRKISAVRAFSRFLKDQGLTTTDAALELRRPRVRHVLPVLLDEDQARAVCEAPQLGSYADARLDRTLRLRDQALLEIFYGTAIRCAELAAVRLDCCALRTVREGRTRRVELVIRILRGKGGKARTVVARGAAVVAYRRYLARRKELDPRTDHLFVGAQGRPLAPPGMRRVVRLWGDVVGVLARPHALRHAFCSHTLQRGANLLFVRYQMGHSSLATTSLYAQTAGLELGPEVAAFHPRARP